jgi:ribosomal protein L29
MKIKEELKDLRNKNLKDLSKLLDKENDKIRELRFSQGFRKLKDSRIVGKTKAKIARIWTVMGEKIDIQEPEKK